MVPPLSTPLNGPPGAKFVAPYVIRDKQAGGPREAVEDFVLCVHVHCYNAFARDYFSQIGEFPRLEIIAHEMATAIRELAIITRTRQPALVE